MHAKNSSSLPSSTLYRSLLLSPPLSIANDAIAAAEHRTPPSPAMDLPVVDLAPYLDAAACGGGGGGGGGPDRRAEEEVVALCAAVSGSLRDTGALLVKDPRCSAEDNDRFLDMMERYFERSEEFKRLQERPNLHYQVGFSPSSSSFRLFSYFSLQFHYAIGKFGAIRASAVVSFW